jgi:hypothetical protein
MNHENAYVVRKVSEQCKNKAIEKIWMFRVAMEIGITSHTGQLKKYKMIINHQHEISDR